jgi:hypothetical protein
MTEPLFDDPHFSCQQCGDPAMFASVHTDNHYRSDRSVETRVVVTIRCPIHNNAKDSFLLLVGAPEPFESD